MRKEGSCLLHPSPHHHACPHIHLLSWPVMRLFVTRVPSPCSDVSSFHLLLCRLTSVRVIHTAVCSSMTHRGVMSKMFYSGDRFFVRSVIQWKWEEICMFSMQSMGMYISGELCTIMRNNTSDRGLLTLLIHTFMHLCINVWMSKIFKVTPINKVVFVNISKCINWHEQTMRKIRCKTLP